jgi:hypothetical protein
VRKHIGWGHIDPSHADRLNQFYTGLLNPYVNYHRPSAQAEIQIDAKGRKRRVYKQWRTPLETLLALDSPERFLRSGMTIDTLQRIARTMSDTEAAKRLQTAKQHLFADLQKTA